MKFRGVAFIALTVLYSLLFQVESKCPSLFEQFNLACYYFGNNPVNTVQDAFRTCYSLGGYLLNVNAELENSHVVEKIKQQPRMFDGYWIGGFFNGKNWVWQKTDQSGTVLDIFMNPQEAQYKNWGTDQPNAIGLFDYRPYVAIMTRYRPTPYKWYSETGLLQMPGGMSFVCEADWQPDV